MIACFIRMTNVSNLHAIQTPVSHGTVQHYQPELRDLEQTPYKMSDLSTGAQLIVWGIRHWLNIRRFPGRMGNQMFEAHDRIKVPEAAEYMEECMALLASAAMRSVIIEPPCQAHLSCDELTLLHTFRALQSGKPEVAHKSIARLMHGRIGRVFCRSASDYALALKSVGFNLAKISQLKVVQE